MIINEIYGMSNECPEEVQSWMKSKMFKSPIWFKNGRDHAECICGECGKTYFYNYIERTGIRPKLHRLDNIQCPYCEHYGIATYMSQTRSRYASSAFYLFEHVNGNDVAVRVFDVFKKTQQPSRAEYSINETARYIMMPGKAETYRLVWYGFDHEHNEAKYQWRANKTGKVSVYAADAYPGWKDIVAQSSLTYFRPEDYRGSVSTSGPSSILTLMYAYSNCPSIEMFEKVGLSRLTYEIVNNGGRLGVINRKGKTMKTQLRLTDQENIRILKEYEGDPNTLLVLQYKEKSQKKMSIDDIKWIIGIGTYYFGGIKYLLDYMSITQLRNRTEKYCKQRYQKSAIGSSYYAGSIINEYKDYLAMRQELGYDMTNEVYLYPRDLHDAHQKMVDERERLNNKDLMKLKNAQYKNIPKRYDRLSNKYAYKHDGLVIRIPRYASDIISEGRKMHHCVGRDQYLRSHDMGTTSILFLRHEDHPNTPFVTIEVKDTKILQWYEAHDRKEHRDIVEPFLDKWIEHIKGE